MAAQLLAVLLSPEALPLYLLLVPLLLLYYSATTIRRPAGEQAAAACHGERPLPAPPSKLPLIGHLHLIGTDPHVSLATLTAQHGDGGLLLLRLGQVRNLVVTTPGAAEAVLRTHDHVFASRPQSAFADALLDGADIAFAPYGEFWRQLRRLVTTHLLSARKVLSLRAGREEEARLVMAKIGDAAATRTAVDVSTLLATFTNDIACRAVSGKFFREEGRNELFREVIDGNVAAFAGFNPQDYFPSLAKVEALARLLFPKMTRLRKRWDGLLDRIIDDHASKAASQQQEEDEEETDFVDVLLARQHEYSLTRKHIKAILVDMFVAGTDTSYVVLEFAMAELMRKPHLMAKLQAEVRDKTPKGQQMVMEDDLGGMPYLKAVLKETLRLHPPLPLLLPHFSMDKCVINGYTVPAETRVIINVWAISRDPGSWKDAEEFIPERFEDAASPDYKGRDFGILPFGAGRRICPGINFGMASVEIMLANLAYCFDWELPGGMQHKDLDMTEVFGMTIHRKENLLLVPRAQDVSHE